MKTSNNSWARMARLALAAGSLWAGILVGVTGVTGVTGCCHCGDRTPIEPGTYEIVENLSRPELVGGLVEITTDRVEVSFTDADGQDWVVDYTVEDKI